MVLGGIPGARPRRLAGPSGPPAFRSTPPRHLVTAARSANRGQGDRFSQAVTAPAARFALAVGSDLNGTQTQTLTERWNGSVWSIEPSPSPGQDYNSLQAVADRGTTTAWAVGAQRATPGAAFRPARAPADSAWLAAEAGPQHEHPLHRGPERRLVQGPVPVVLGQRDPRLAALARPQRRAQDEVHPGAGRHGGPVPGGTERMQGTGFQRVGDRNAGETEPLAQLTADDRVG